MLDLLLLPATLLLVLGIRAVRRGEQRQHGHLMTGAFTFIGLRILLPPHLLRPMHLALWLGVLGLAGTTLLLGRKALAWREARSDQAVYPRIHRAMGILTLIGLGFTALVWLLRDRT